MTQHLDLGTTRAWLEGTLKDELMEGVALHLDGCPACRARLTRRDPLDAAWAHPAPEIPSQLVTQALARARANPSTWIETGISLTLLVLVTVAVGFALPSRLADLTATVRGVLAVAHSLQVWVGPFSVLALVATALSGSLALRQSWKRFP